MDNRFIAPNKEKGKVFVDINAARFKIIIGDSVYRLDRTPDPESFVEAIQMVACNAFQQGIDKGKADAKKEMFIQESEILHDKEKELAFYEKCVLTGMANFDGAAPEAGHVLSNLAFTSVENRRNFITYQQKAPD